MANGSQLRNMQNQHSKHESSVSIVIALFITRASVTPRRVTNKFVRNVEERKARVDAVLDKLVGKEARVDRSVDVDHLVMVRFQRKVKVRHRRVLNNSRSGSLSVCDLLIREVRG